MTLVLVLAAGIAFTIWRIQRATPTPRPERVTPTVARDAATTCPDGQWCERRHYYRKAFADMWRCVNCGHLQPVTATEVLDIAAEDFRGDLPLIESYANGEVSQ